MGRKSNHAPHALITISLAVFLLTAGVWHFVELTKASIAENVTVTALVLGCGDGLIELGEDCDGSNMNSHTCVTEGFLSGSISCTPSCTLNTSACSSTPSGGGTTPVVAVSSTNQIFTGYTSPGATVTVLKDGQTASTVTADSMGTFYAQFSNLTNGSYTFSFQATDSSGSNSSLSSVSIQAAGGTNTTSDIFLSPTIADLPTDISALTEVLVPGETAPGALVTVSLFSPTGTLVTSQQVTADGNGAYTASFATAPLTISGTYTITAVAGKNSLMSAVSLPADLPVNVIPPVLYMPGDYNENNRVNLVDFSIALYWYKEQLTDSFKILEIRHGNGDGLLNLIDISIIAYWWTG